MNTDRGRLFHDITHIEKSPVSANAQRLALGATTSDLSADSPVMAIYPREARAPHQVNPQSNSAISRAGKGQAFTTTEENAAASIDMIPPEGQDVNTEKTGGQKDGGRPLKKSRF